MSHRVEERTHPDPKPLSTGELISELTATTSQLVRDEIQLAMAELKDKGDHAGIGVGMFGAAGLVAFLGGAHCSPPSSQRRPWRWTSGRPR